MNPDYLEETLSSFLKDNDETAFASLKRNDKKYKMSYQTVHDV